MNFVAPISFYVITFITRFIPGKTQIFIIMTLFYIEEIIIYHHFFILGQIILDIWCVLKVQFLMIALVVPYGSLQKDRET